MATSYDDLLASLGLTYKDLGLGTYGMLDSSGTQTGIGYKNLDDSIKDYSLNSLSQYIKQVGPEGMQSAPSGHYSTQLRFDSEQGLTQDPVWVEDAPSASINQNMWYLDTAGMPRPVSNVEAGGNGGGWFNPYASFGQTDGNWTDTYGSLANYHSDTDLGTGTWNPEIGGYDKIYDESRYTPNYYDSKDALTAALSNSQLTNVIAKNFQGGNANASDQQKWEALGNLISGQNIQNPTSWRDFGGDTQTETISGKNALYGSTPVFTNGVLTGYKVPMTVAENGDYGYAGSLGVSQSDKSGSATSNASLRREYLDPAGWNAISTDNGDGTRTVPIDKIDQIPGFNNLSSYDFKETDGGKFGFGNFLTKVALPVMGGVLGGGNLLTNLFGDSASGLGALNSFDNGAMASALGGGSGAAGAAGGTSMSWLNDIGSWFGDNISSGGDWLSNLLNGTGGGASQFTSALSGSADPVEAMYQAMSATGTTSVTDAASALGFNSANAMLGAINPSWLSAGGSFLTDAATQAAKKVASSAVSGALGGSGSLLGAGLGGLLGSLGTGSKPAGTTDITQTPWGPQQAYLLDAWNKAKAASGDNPLQTQANSNYSSVLSGPTTNPMLGLDNPYLQKQIDYANQDVTRAMMPAMNQANIASGSFGNSGVADTYGKAMTDAYWKNANDMRYKDYYAQQQLQKDAVGNTLGFTTGASAYNSAPSQNYAKTVQGNYGGTTSSPYFTNPTNNILGGAAIGSQLGKLWG
jgi:hypothetical protein